MRLVLLLCALAVGGCATTLTPTSTATQVPPERLIAFQAAASDSGTIVVTRDVGFIGKGCSNGFMINGELAARFAAGETATFHVPSGKLLFRSGSDPQGRGLCSGGKDNWTQRESWIKPGETKRFRLTLSSEGQPDIQRAD